MDGEMVRRIEKEDLGICTAATGESDGASGFFGNQIVKK
jgi:hypothetical protein